MVASLQQRLRVRRGALLAPEEMAAADAGRRLAHGRLGLVGRLVGHLLRLVGQLEARHTGHQARDAHIVRPALCCTDRWAVPELKEIRRLIPMCVKLLPL